VGAGVGLAVGAGVAVGFGVAVGVGFAAKLREAKQTLAITSDNETEERIFISGRRELSGRDRRSFDAIGKLNRRLTRIC
jgi:hypothetical protein